ncbi:hypothetical protein HPB47_023481 [Ixodes persulcatus]|uniref:Uncharacterized protein n=1 Tax=Ixodes persulcatus TaxID=34615 RepID=A0AC60Q7I2_IXOPE|nr:hypothetical protein HPB47_023481 [Ixodes persulcatus]
MAAGSDDGSLASHTQLSDEAFFQLFQMVEDSPCLWKTDHEGYKSIRKKDRTWGELCERLQRRYANLGNLNSDVLRRLFNNKRRQFLDEKRRKTVWRSGESAPTYVGRWRYFGALTFLDKTFPPRPRVTVLDIKEEPVITFATEVEPSECMQVAVEEEEPESPDDRRLVLRLTRNSAGHCNGRRAALDDNALPAAPPAAPSENDEAAIFGKLIASHLRRLPVRKHTWFQTKILSYVLSLEGQEFDEGV